MWTEVDPGDKVTFLANHRADDLNGSIVGYRTNDGSIVSRWVSGYRRYWISSAADYYCAIKVRKASNRGLLHAADGKSPFLDQLPDQTDQHFTCRPDRLIPQ